MKEIIEMNKREILGLDPSDFVNRTLASREVVYIAKILGAAWQFDMDKALEGKPGYHAVLKSELHSNGFFVSKILLEPENILEIMAGQIVRKMKFVNEHVLREVRYVCGLPKGATGLGLKVSGILKKSFLEMEKIDGRIVLEKSARKKKGKILIVEDVCTRGTAFKEAVDEIRRCAPELDIVSSYPVILNRGCQEYVMTKVGRSFQVISVASVRVDDWEKKECPLCSLGSIPIKPKETEENWKLITTGQI